MLGGWHYGHAFDATGRTLATFERMIANTNNIVPFRTVDEGIVKRVFRNSAELELIQTGARGYLHISRFSDKDTNPPLTDFVREGEILPVVVGRFSSRHDCWEVSHRAYLRRRKLEALGFAHGETRVAEIQHATELGCTLKLQQATAYLATPPHPWSKYRVLFQSGRLAQGRSIEVVIGTWSPEAEGLLVQLPTVRADQLSQEIQRAEVILLRPRYIKGKHKLQSVMYLELVGQGIARIDVSELLDVETAFPVGSRAPIQAEAVDVYTGLIKASVVWEQTQFSTPIVIPIGEIRSGVVTRTTPYGAICLLDNRVAAFMHKSTVFGSVSENLDKYLRPGDLVEVKTLEECTSQGSNRVEFVRRIEPFNEEQNEEAALLDLAAVRRRGTTGGFSRDIGFRWSVLDAYDHHCCICGTRYAFRDSSAMEAAHVVPRGGRGSNLLQNGLCLCPVHHWAFDKGLLAIDEDLSIRVADVILASGNEGSWLSELHGQVAHIAEDAPISREALAWHRRNIFLDG